MPATFIKETEIETIPLTEETVEEDTSTDFETNEFIPESELETEEEEEGEHTGNDSDAGDITKPEQVPSSSPDPENPPEASYEDKVRQLLTPSGVDEIEKDSPYQTTAIGGNLEEMDEEAKNSELNILNSLLVKHLDFGLQTVVTGMNTLQNSYVEIQRQALRTEWGEEFDAKFEYAKGLITQENSPYKDYDSLEGMRLLAEKYDNEQFRTGKKIVTPVTSKTTTQRVKTTIPAFDSGKGPSNADKKVYTKKELDNSDMTDAQKHKLALSRRVKY